MTHTESFCVKEGEPLVGLGEAPLQAAEDAWQRGSLLRIDTDWNKGALGEVNRKPSHC
jgi:hypothetical protein